MNPLPSKRRRVSRPQTSMSFGRGAFSKSRMNGAAWGLRIGFVVALVVALWYYRPTDPHGDAPISPLPAPSTAGERDDNGFAGESDRESDSPATRPGTPHSGELDEPSSIAGQDDRTAPNGEQQTDGDRSFEPLDAELRLALERIASGGPYPYRQDDTVFFNRERRLPEKPLGYYREFTVKTPGAGDRGPRRVVRGQEGELYYTADHYRSFERLDVLRLRDPPAGGRQSEPVPRRPVRTGSFE